MAQMTPSINARTMRLRGNRMDYVLQRSVDPRAAATVHTCFGGTQEAMKSAGDFILSADDIGTTTLTEHVEAAQGVVVKHCYAASW